MCVFLIQYHTRCYYDVMQMTKPLRGSTMEPVPIPAYTAVFRLQCIPITAVTAVLPICPSPCSPLVPVVGADIHAWHSNNISVYYRQLVQSIDTRSFGGRMPLDPLTRLGSQGWTSCAAQWNGIAPFVWLLYEPGTVYHLTSRCRRKFTDVDLSSQDVLFCLKLLQ